MASKSKINLIFFSFILVAFLFLSFSSARAQQQSCATIQLSKSSYLSGELFQAEITGNFQKAITLDDISFRFGGQEYSPAFGFEQAARDKWLVWMNTPKDYGENSISVKTLCKSDILRQETVNAYFTIQRPLQEAYDSLAFQVEGKWSSLGNDDLPLALSALSYNKKLFAEANSELLSRQSNGECWPRSGCNVKTTALSMEALNGISNLNKSIRWMLDSENNVGVGLWDLIINANSAQACSIIINNQSQNVNLVSGLNRPISLNLPNDREVVLSANCSILGAKVSHTYLGGVHDFSLSKQTDLYAVTLNNNKCWGQSYRSECDADSTAQALLTLTALGQTGLSNELNWLGKNLATTEQKSIYHYLAKDSETEQWLINNQAIDGYWSSSELAVSDVPDIPSTVMALKSLSGITEAKGEQWLKAIFETKGNFGTVKESGYALKIFSPDKIEPIVTSKGLFKVSGGKSLAIKFSNSGNLATNLTVSLGGLPSQTNILPSLDREVTIVAPTVSEITFSYAEVSYTTEFGNQRSYKLPVIILPSSVKETQFSDIINGVSSGGTSLLPSEIKFSQGLSNITLQKSKKTSANITIISSSTRGVNISLTAFGLYDILSGIEPSNFELQPNQARQITIYFDTENAFGVYSGTINAESEGISISLPLSIAISEEKSDKTCSKLSGTICGSGSICGGTEIAAKDGSCCTTTCKKSATAQTTSYGKFAGWGMLVLAVLVGVAYVYFKLRKKPISPLNAALQKMKEVPTETP